MNFYSMLVLFLFVNYYENKKGYTMVHKNSLSKILFSFILLSSNSILVSDRAHLVEMGTEIKQPITPSFYGGVIGSTDLNTGAAAGGAMYTI